MLLAPMTFEDQVLGVLVLSKLGLHQFSDDDLRLLVIYASFAAQAFANAIGTERLQAQSEALERQLVNQRGLLQVTESILTTLDPRAILDQCSSEDEFEVVKFFAAQVSIALQNAGVHRAVEIRAQTDDLTGLLNHGTFQSWLDRSVETREPFSLIMLDLDDFKAVNDALGHQAGDRLLAELAHAIVGAGRDSDHVFRYGGDEFSVLLPGTDATSALAVAERIRGAIHSIGGAGATPGAQHKDDSVSVR